MKDLTRPYEYDGDEAIQPHHTDPIQSEVKHEEENNNTISNEPPLSTESETKIQNHLQKKQSYRINN